jgi:hypothetical protein
VSFKEVLDYIQIKRMLGKLTHIDPRSILINIILILSQIQLGKT